MYSQFYSHNKKRILHEAKWEVSKVGISEQGEDTVAQFSSVWARVTF